MPRGAPLGRRRRRMWVQERSETACRGGRQRDAGCATRRIGRSRRLSRRTAASLGDNDKTPVFGGHRDRHDATLLEERVRLYLDLIRNRILSGLENIQKSMALGEHELTVLDSRRDRKYIGTVVSIAVIGDEPHFAIGDNDIHAIDMPALILALWIIDDLGQSALGNHDLPG